ncbi:acylamino-acid-releasing enzyme-like [Clavelina lepadiformis]|uniref:acylamino-acid-releasing enzyme-like n=1 Tax=Clavelina lepadiformis TaxID=159417 RepID=UPI0040419C7F
MSYFEENCVSIYRDLARFSSLDGVIVTRSDVRDDVTHWEATWSHRDIERNSKVSFRSTGSLFLENGTLTKVNNSGTTEINGEKFVRVSPCGKKKAILREVLVKDTKHCFLEIWSGLCKTFCIDLTDEDIHGKVHFDSVFGCLEWSYDGSKVLYVAEKKLQKTCSFFKKSKDADTKRGDEFLYRDEWGEQLVGSYHPTLYYYDLKSSMVFDLGQHLPNDISVSNALWSRDDSSVVFIGWKSSPWKLGLMYCKNRFSTLYKIDLSTKDLFAFSDGTSCVFAAGLSPDGSRLICLESVPFGPHMQCCKLKCLDFNETTTPPIVVDVVNKPVDSNSFQGLFVDTIPRNCWLSNDELILHSIHRSNIALLKINIRTGNLLLLETEGVWNVLCVSNGIIFASHSTPNVPPVLKCASYDSTKNTLEWVTLETPFAALTDIKWSIKKFQPKLVNNDFPDLDIEAVLLQPSGENSSCGLIVNPHGGPHSACTAGFDLFSACFCKLGFNVLRVNYRGSLGCGQNNVLSLPGNVGKQDVADVQQAAQIIARDLHVPSNKIFVQGGSHGGFLTLHLVGQFPDFYAAGGVRNPVCNISTMVSATDITDWCFYEGGLPFSYDKIMTPESCQKLLECSPIRYVKEVKSPLLFMIGSSDLRVPPSQSHEYIHALQGLGKEVRVLKYDNNNHPISKVDAEADCFMNFALWFHNH